MAEIQGKGTLRRGSSSSDEDNNVFTSMEVSSAFMEGTFKTKLNAAYQKKKIAKLGMPDSRWTKSPVLDSFITSTVPKEGIHNENIAQRLWLEAWVVMAAIVDNSNTDQISDSEGIRNTISLFGNASQQHFLQRRNTT